MPSSLISTLLKNYHTIQLLKNIMILSAPKRLCRSGYFIVGVIKMGMSCRTIKLEPLF